MPPPLKRLIKAVHSQEVTTPDTKIAASYLFPMENLVFPKRRIEPVQQMNKLVCIARQTPAKPVVPAGIVEINLIGQYQFRQLLTQQDTASVEKKSWFRQSRMGLNKTRAGDAVSIHENEIVCCARPSRQITGT